jgi:hypothetical protein
MRLSYSVVEIIALAISLGRLYKRIAENMTISLTDPFTLAMVRLCLILPLLTLPAVGQAQFIYTVAYGQVTITGYTGPGGDVTIPSTLADLPVTGIGSYAFDQSTSLTSIVIPTSVTSIGNSAFSGCTSLTNVMIPNSVTSIGDAAFFLCTSLRAIMVLPFNSVYKSVDGVLFNNSQTRLIQYPPGKAGSNFTIPNGVTSIVDWAFYGCAGLTNLTIGYGVTNIGSGAFGGCTSLTSMTIPNSVTSIGSYAFIACYSLKGVTIPNSLTSIGTQVFGSCGSLTTVTIPSSVTSMGDFAFSWCTGLRGVYFQGNAPGLGWSVFYNCSSATVYYLAGTTNWGSTFGGLPTMAWKPRLETSDDSFGVRTNQFGFNVTWANGMVVVVEACMNLTDHFWAPLQTNTLIGGSFYFSDPAWTNNVRRFYRVRSP